MTKAKRPGVERLPSASRQPSDDDNIKDSVAFVKGVLGEEPYDKQEQILRAVGRCRRVSVVGCNGSGKDWVAARAVLWWIRSRSPVKAIVTGPTTRQVDDARLVSIDNVGQRKLWGGHYVGADLHFRFVKAVAG